MAATGVAGPAGATVSTVACLIPKLSCFAVLFAGRSYLSNRH